MDIYPAAAELLRDVPIDQPILCLRPHVAARAARWFLKHFPGEKLYAVKANDSPHIIDALWAAGIPTDLAAPCDTTINL
jgi:ornithine decarboxylase